GSVLWRSPVGRSRTIVATGSKVRRRIPLHAPSVLSTDPRLPRILSNVIFGRALHAVLIRIVVYHRMLTTEVVEWWRRSRGPLQRSSFPRIVGGRSAPEPTVDQVVQKNKLGSAGE